MRLTRHIVISIGIGVLAACTSTPVTRPVDTQAVEARARAEVESGNLEAAARLYRQLADGSRGTIRSGYLIEGARLLVARMDPATAGSWLSEAEPSADQDQQQLILVLRARIELDAARPDMALQLLARLAQPVPLPVLREAAQIRGYAYFGLGRYADGVREFVEREIWLDDAAEILANQRSIWDSLPADAAATAPTGDPVIDGWLALAPLARVQAEPAEFRRRLLEWRQTYVAHPAAGGLLAELLNEQRTAGTRPTQIALLLPLSSSQRTQAIAVRDGFLASHLESGHIRESTVTVYDTAARGATNAYLQAQLDGADFIVGPLLRPEVEEVMGQSGFIPTLALNWAQIDAPFLQSFYQFGLAPEDEVRAIAQQAIAANQTTAIALVASDERGYRLLNSFRAEFEALGGRVLGSAGYVPGARDVAGTITSLLNIARSTQRHRRLEANLGVDVAFEPRRRQDVGMIFLQADSPMGRLLAPNLRFYYAGDIPTYATSEIFDPGNRGGDADLNGVMFPDVPLLLSPDLKAAGLIRELQAHWPQRAAQWIRLYGLGFDAYQLIPALYSEDAAAWPLAGISGRLSIDPLGRIRRDMPFAQFRNGRPVALAPLARPADQSGEFVGSR
jgi:outer membrane PBP1 activator LpoA protein